MSEPTSEWGDEPWTNPETAAEKKAASRITALMPTLNELESSLGSMQESIRPEHAPPHQESPEEVGVVVREEVIGAGGMSVVLAGEQRALGRSVAIKTLRDSDRGRERAMQVLLREARITGRLEHPNVLPLYDLQIDQGQPQLVLKRIEGRPWSQLIRNPDAILRTHGAEDVLTWHMQVLIQVCNAIRFAHARGIVHRDLKPDNVMVGEFGEVYVLDWGIAVAAGDPSRGGLAGTPSYMAPEMARGEPVDARTDVYLLGAVLFELLHQHPPHQGKTFPAVVWRALMSQPEIDPEVSEAFAGIIRKAMAPLPEDRFEDVDAFKRAVVRALSLGNAVGVALLLKLRKGWNRYDRRLLAVFALGFFAEFWLDALHYHHGISPQQTLVHDLVVRGFMIGVAAIYVERILVLPACFFGVAAVGAALYPATVLWWVVATNALVVAVLMWRWRPRKAAPPTTK